MNNLENFTYYLFIFVTERYTNNPEMQKAADISVLFFPRRCKFLDHAVRCAISPIRCIGKCDEIHAYLYPAKHLSVIILFICQKHTNLYPWKLNQLEASENE